MFRRSISSAYLSTKGIIVNLQLKFRYPIFRMSTEALLVPIARVGQSSEIRQGQYNAEELSAEEEITASAFLLRCVFRI